MNIQYKTTIPSVKDFNMLLKSAELKQQREDILKKSLVHTAYCICAYQDKKLIGFGRLIGDEAMYLYIQNLVVNKEYQSKGIGTNIMKKLLTKVDKYTKKNPDIKVNLYTLVGKEEFYEKFGFVKRPNDELGSGMILKKYNV